MLDWQILFIICYAVFGFYGALIAYRKCRHKKEAYTLTPQYYIYGAFVWADMLVFGFFWAIVCCVVLFMQDWLLFLLILSVFWLVRSVGETIYWFNQQFSTIERNPPRELPGFFLVHDDSIWFVYQIIAQLVTVVSFITTVILVPLWLTSLGIL